LSKSLLFPFASSSARLRKKGQLSLGGFALLSIALMFHFLEQGSFESFVIVSGLFFIVFAYCVIYFLGGKTKPIWLIGAMALAQIALLELSVFDTLALVFRHVLPGDVRATASSTADFFVHHFFGTGLLEELSKAIPVFLCILVARFLRSPLKEKVEVVEPLDGILLCAASAAGFVFVETLFQYVPNTVEAQGAAAGLALLLPRTIGSIFGHMAWSGYFGYAIGLAMMMPARRWLILSAGWIVAALAHAFWNTSTNFGVAGTLIGGAVAYILLVAAILKAREISPSRGFNFATQVIGTAAPAAPVSSPAGAGVHSPAGAPGPQPAHALHVDGRSIELIPGKILNTSDIRGLDPAANDTTVADVVTHPAAAGVLGLRNRSRQTWIAVLPNGSRQSIAPMRSVRLMPGVSLQLGRSNAELH
jgi:Predicted membrane protein